MFFPRNAKGARRSPTRPRRAGCRKSQRGKRVMLSPTASKGFLSLRETWVNWRRQFSSFIGIRKWSSVWAWPRAGASSKISRGTIFAHGCSALTSSQCKWPLSAICATRSSHRAAPSREHPSHSTKANRRSDSHDACDRRPAGKIPGSNTLLGGVSSGRGFAPGDLGSRQSFRGEGKSGRCARLDRDRVGHLCLLPRFHAQRSLFILDAAFASAKTHHLGPPEPPLEDSGTQLQRIRGISGALLAHCRLPSRLAETVGNSRRIPCHPARLTGLHRGKSGTTPDGGADRRRILDSSPGVGPGRKILGSGPLGTVNRSLRGRASDEVRPHGRPLSSGTGADRHY